MGGGKTDLGYQRQAIPLGEYHLGTAGYIITQHAARKMLHQLRTLSAQDIIHIDRLIFDHFPFQDKIITIHQMLPALCVQEFILRPTAIAMPSVIEQERLDFRRHHKPKRSLSAKIKGELGNAWRKTFGQLNRTFIDFQ